MPSHLNQLIYDDVLQLIVDQLYNNQNCHTIILYGSRAKGTHTKSSDYDLLAIRQSGESLRDARFWNGVYLDIFIYNEIDVLNIDASFLRIRGGIVLREQENLGHKLLTQVDELLAAEPPELPPSEIEVRRSWSYKMLERISEGDIEANYRRVWLLFTLLEDYFAFRKQWYLGSKESWIWLQNHDPQTYIAFEKALKPDASFSEIKSLTKKLFGRSR